MPSRRAGETRYVSGEKRGCGTSESTGGAEQNQCMAQSHGEAGFGGTPHPRRRRDAAFPALPSAYAFRHQGTLQLRRRGGEENHQKLKSQGEFPLLEPSPAVTPTPAHPAGRLTIRAPLYVCTLSGLLMGNACCAPAPRKAELRAATSSFALWGQGFK